jgi:hypothetical protein
MVISHSQKPHVACASRSDSRQTERQNSGERFWKTLLSALLALTALTGVAACASAFDTKTVTRAVGSQTPIAATAGLVLAPLAPAPIAFAARPRVCGCRERWRAQRRAGVRAPAEEGRRDGKFGCRISCAAGQGGARGQSVPRECGRVRGGLPRAQAWHREFVATPAMTRRVNNSTSRKRSCSSRREDGWLTNGRVFGKF